MVGGDRGRLEPRQARKVELRCMVECHRPTAARRSMLSGYFTRNGGAPSDDNGTDSAG